MDHGAQASSLSGELPSLAPGQLTRLLGLIAAAPTRRAVTWKPPAAGDRLGRFLLVREIGRGGFGIVFESEDTELRRRVAVKVVLPTQAARDSADWVRREAEAAAQLRHPNVVTLHDAGVQDGKTFLVYELLRGETLRQRLERGRPPRPEACRILREVASGLAHLHTAGVVHRDLKAGNVFIETDGRVKLLDLGLAQVAGACGHAGGSPPYAAPEQWRAEVVDARADVHAWGVLGHELLTGELPDRAPAPAARVRSVEALVARARAADPALRPADGAALGAALDGIAQRQRRRRTLRLIAIAIAAVLLLAASGSRWLKPPPARPPGPFRLAIADADNGTGDASLDGLGDLVARGLDASPALHVLDRGRIAGVLRASGRVVPEHVDAATARFAARQSGAAAVMIPSARRSERGFELRIDVREPETDALVFELSERAASTEAVVGAVDRLVHRARQALHERESDVRATEREIARTVSASLEAHQRYFAGRRCIDRPSEGASWVRIDCAHHFREALAIDPEFPLAHFELAWLARWDARPTDELRAILEPALRRIARLPAREQAQVRAWKAALDGDMAGGTALLRHAAEEFPEDAHVALALGELLYQDGRMAEAVPPLERAFALDPGLELASDELSRALGLLDRRAALQALATRLAASAPSPGALHAEVQARGWSGDTEGALEAARRAAVGGGGAAIEDLEDALVAAERWDEAEALLRSEAAKGVERAGRRLGNLLFMRGRAREARALDRPLSDGDDRTRFLRGAWRAHRLAGDRDAKEIQRIVEETRSWSSEMAASLAPMVAYAGDLELAAKLATELPAGSGERDLVEALVTWKQGGAAEALPTLRRLARADPTAVQGLAAEAMPWIAAECAIAAGAGESALPDLRWFQRFYAPLGMWRAWAYPRSLVLEARLLAASGRRAEALAALATFDRLWARADPGLPLAAEARALRRSLAANGSISRKASDGRRP